MIIDHHLLSVFARGIGIVEPAADRIAGKEDGAAAVVQTDNYADGVTALTGGRSRFGPLFPASDERHGRLAYPRWYPLFLCALRTGLRQGELLALRWADMDFAGGFLRVEQNIVKGTLTTPKNHQRRRVDMSAQLALELQALRRRERARCLKAGIELPAIVFASAEGTYLDVGNVRRAFYRALTAAELRHIRFHDLRHTFASLLIQQGESLAYVRDQLGQRSIQITADV